MRARSTTIRALLSMRSKVNGTRASAILTLALATQKLFSLYILSQKTKKGSTVSTNSLCNLTTLMKKWNNIFHQQTQGTDQINAIMKYLTFRTQLRRRQGWKRSRENQGRRKLNWA